MQEVMTGHVARSTVPGMVAKTRRGTWTPRRSWSASWWPSVSGMPLVLRSSY